MRVEYHPEARLELARAARRYESERRGLGLAFVTAVRAAEALINAHPDAGVSLAESRRYLVQRFPYSIVYRCEADRVLILAIAHARRRPGYWHDRR